MGPIEHLALNVSDSPKMASWYESNLGLRVVRSFGAPHHGRFLADCAGRTVLEFYTNRGAAIPDYGSQHPLVLHLAFAVSDLDHETERLVQAGATIFAAPHDAEEGRFAMLRDPWGLPIQLVSRLVPLL